ncbi:MAG TPA: DUF6644 family protein [Terriglobales bacterium]|jgi:hypothetical protein|nr:DUF6644 family protein [Terriglobales bacterium]
MSSAWASFWTALHPVFLWAHASFPGVWVRNHGAAFPVVETFHLLALAMLFGSIVIVDLRLMGLMMKPQPVSQLASDLAPWTLGALAVMLGTGYLLFASEADRCYDSQPFKIKMAFLFVSILFHFTAYRKVTRSEQVSGGTGWSMAFISLALWFGVGLGGRAIGFLS